MKLRDSLRLRLRWFQALILFQQSRGFLLLVQSNACTEHCQYACIINIDMLANVVYKMLTYGKHS